MTRTLNSSSSSDCGCKKPTGMKAANVESSASLYPIMAEFVGETPGNNVYYGKVTGTAYYSVFTGAVFQVYTADYLADKPSFEPV